MKLAGVATAAVFASAGPLFAQVVDGGPLAGWLSVFVQLGSFGLVAYLIVKGLPDLQKEVKTERQAERSDFVKALDAGRAEFTAAMNSVSKDRKEERADFAAALKVITDFARLEVEAIRAAARQEVENLRAVFVQEQRETRAYFAAEADAVRKVYFDAVGAMRTAVHDVRDVANATVQKANVVLEVAKQQQK